MRALRWTLFAALAAGAIETASAQGSADWQFEATPYLWSAAMKGDTQAGNLPLTHVNMSFGDILENLDAGCAKVRLPPPVGRLQQERIPA